MRVVLDTNVFVSSFLSPTGASRRVIDLWKRGEITLCLSAEILREYIEVLSRLGLSGTPELEDLLELFKTRPNLLFTAPTTKVRVVDADPDDVKFIDCALAAGARVIVSGDRHLLRIGSYGDVAMVTRTAFLKSTGVAEEQAPYERVKHILGSVGSGTPDLGERHREHLSPTNAVNGAL